MAEQKGISGTIVALSAFMGAVFGAVAGLLLAPQSGKQTRGKINETYKDLSENLSGMVDKASEKIPEVISKVSTEIKGIPGEVKEEFQTLKEKATEQMDKVVDKGKSYLSEIKETVSTSIEEGKKQFMEEKEKHLESE
jgi:gas vesicle protein